MAGDFKIGDDHRRRTTDQLDLLRQANDGRVAWDTEAPADFTYLYDPDHVLVRAADTDDFERALARTEGIFDGTADRLPDPVDGELARYRLPARRKGESLPDVLDLLDADPEFGPGRATLDHYLHVTPGGGTACPATEPEETGLDEPWPPRVRPRPRQGRQRGRRRHGLAPAGGDRPADTLARTTSTATTRTTAPTCVSTPATAPSSRAWSGAWRRTPVSSSRGSRSTASAGAASWSRTWWPSSSRPSTTSRRSSTCRPGAAPARTGPR